MTQASHLTKRASFSAVSLIGLLALHCSAPFSATSNNGGGDAGASDSGGASGTGSTSGDAGRAESHGGASAASGTSGDSGAAGEAGTACDSSQSPSEAACLVSDDYAIFVAPTGKDIATGTKARPVRTITKALALAGKTKVVIVCNATYNEQIKLTGATRLFGGFSCPGSFTPWSYEPGKMATDAPSPRGPALIVQSGASSVVVEDFEFDAREGEVLGDSSVAGIVNASSTVVLNRVTLVAGDGVDGADGVGLTAPVAPGPNGNNGLPACVVATGKNFGGASVESMCGGAPSGSIGGRGGDGGSNASSAGNGDRGYSIPQPDTGSGSPGVGETSASWNCGFAPDKGGANAGANGTSQPAAAGSGIGELSPSGYIAANGASGLDGLPGQGGGGGGGAKAPASCGNLQRTGASGGGGGGGGCGGKGGPGGQSGGGSIALVVMSSVVELGHVKLVAGSGGKGGKGGPGQAGGLGGNPGRGASGGSANPSCDGGMGGKGGNGGNGGGGAGGPSIGIAFVGTAPIQTAVDIQIAASAALGGADGAGATTGLSAGSAGVLAMTRKF